MRQDRLNQSFADMMENITNPDRIEDNKRKERRKKRLKAVKSDVGL